MTDNSSAALTGILSALGDTDLTFQRGIEREGLRVDEAGNLARTEHPSTFGSKLCHPTITTDFSESQLELITPVATDLNETFTTMDETHRVVVSGMSDEVLWAASMPCVLGSDMTIPLADYGHSNIGKLKKTYRNGLGNRYGRSMQTICAVHYNFSFPDEFWTTLAKIENQTNSQTYRNRRYFDLMRNFRRYSWLPIYLFGASPAVCNSFVQGREHNLEPFDAGSLHLPFATSLRSGNLGYQSDAQSETMNICYNDLNNYVSTLADAVSTEYSDYAEIGIKAEGEYLQLNNCILQSEAEFYSTIRAKRVAPAGANFLECLRDEGVEYIEVRLMDLDPYEPVGISRSTVRFLDSFLLFCLLSESPAHDGTLCEQVRTNLTAAVLEGRNPELTLKDADQERSLRAWADEILEQMQPIAAHLDSLQQTTEHNESLALQRDKVKDSANTPSERILTAMKEESIPFFRFAMNQSLAHKQHFENEGVSPELAEKFDKIAAASLAAHREIDSSDGPSFDEYLGNILQAYVPLRSDQ